MTGLLLSIKQAFSQINRNKAMSIASFFSIAAIMLVLGVFFIIVVNINNLSEGVKRDFDEIQVYLLDDVEKAQINQISDTINGMAGVTKSRYLSKAQALQEWKTKWGDNAGLLDSLKENPLPNSIIITIENLESASEIVTKVRVMEGVEKVNYSQDTVDKLLRVTNFIQIGALIVIVFLIIISILVLSNTIKLTVVAREREITIMRYVGATNWYIRGPFLLEGMFIGFISALVSAGLVSAFYHFIVNEFGMNFVLILSTGFVSQKFLITNLLIIFLSLGISIGACGSIISMRRFLAR
ncbi:MAG: permease-like cell division protein FtsX [Clostridiales Family XIII bacterium]|jgi:cell division transport system permease protein|nr:permease-like cell division protein FtsX [Clostridiales Family XIII bacterium]